MIEKLLNTLSQVTYLNEEDLTNIASISSVKELQIGNYWFQEGKYVDQIAFIIKGYLRKYFTIDGNEKTDYFYFDNSFTGDLPSIISNKPCKSNNIAMEKTTLVTFSYLKMIELCNTSHNIERLLRLMVEQGFSTYYNKASSFLLQSPKERYNQLLNDHPEIIQRTTQYHIASYLGITPQHLSRLRAES